jgi:hypothetical protein
MTRGFGRIPTGLAVLAFCCLASACSQSVASGQGSAFVGVAVTPLYITVENKAEKALLDVNVSIKQVGILPPLASRIPRLEIKEKRDVMLRDFSSQDGTAYNTTTARPKAIDVTAVDADGAKYTMTAPW